MWGYCHDFVSHYHCLFSFVTLCHTSSLRCLGCRSSDHTVKVWDSSARQCLNTFDDHTDQVRHWLLVNRCLYMYPCLCPCVP